MPRHGRPIHSDALSSSYFALGSDTYWLGVCIRVEVTLYLGRHRVKPGITGWAQVNGYRGETQTVEKMRARVEHDLYYIDHWSLWFDLRILLMTPFVGFIHRNAY